MVQFQEMKGYTLYAKTYKAMEIQEDGSEAYLGLVQKFHHGSGRWEFIPESVELPKSSGRTRKQAVEASFQARKRTAEARRRLREAYPSFF